jgi:hypothetical protein
MLILRCLTALFHLHTLSRVERDETVIVNCELLRIRRETVVVYLNIR